MFNAFYEKRKKPIPRKYTWTNIPKWHGDIDSTAATKTSTRLVNGII